MTTNFPGQFIAMDRSVDVSTLDIQVPESLLVYLLLEAEYRA